jgi:WhiB family redox-sensing transcriptional regulator
MTGPEWEETPIGACTRDPERWTTTADEEAKAICRACPRRWMCAREACELPRAEGLWAGIVIPEGGRGRTFALRQLRSLAERNGARPATLRGIRLSGDPFAAGVGGSAANGWPEYPIARGR